MSTSSPEDPKNRSFEEALSALENRVRKLEAGELPLEEALGLFEEGIELTRECHEKLDAADQKIIELSQSVDKEILETER
jgi:exodeoxyribonuclease VII small subunit